MGGNKRYDFEAERRLNSQVGRKHEHSLSILPDKDPLMQAEIVQTIMNLKAALDRSGTVINRGGIG